MARSLWRRITDPFDVDSLADMLSDNKPIKHCKQDIKMSNDSGNWLPYNLDNSFHE